MTVWNKKKNLTTKKLLETINSKVAGYKINIWKSVVFLYTNNEISEREMKKTISFIITTIRLKYLGLNLEKVKELNTENYETLLKFQNTHGNRKIFYVHRLEELLKCPYYLKQSPGY